MRDWRAPPCHDGATHDVHELSLEGVSSQVREDEEQVRILADDIIQEMRHETLSAGTVKEGIAILESDQHVDLLFTDINFPGELKGGIELAQDAARLRQNIPVLYTTGGQLTDGMQAMFVERSAFLPKPYTPEQLIRSITEILREQPS